MKDESLDLVEVLKGIFPSETAQDELQYVALQQLNAASFYPIKSLTAVSTLRDGDYGDFVYWKRIEAITFDVFGSGSSHQIMMSNLYAIEMLDKHKLPSYFDALEFVAKALNKRLFASAYSDASEAFIMEGYGTFLSSVGHSMKIGPNFKMNFSEKTIFRGINVTRLE